ncbi:MAG: DUF192 domain-containing protein [Rickettsiales bacterium]|jgi:uncharacterized membrane protein (UPF0127 family)|nr:DUF192 domain-containing protein [Rickettsiales bacterium]
MRLALSILVLLMFQLLATTPSWAKDRITDQPIKLVTFNKDVVTVKTKSAEERFHVEIAITEEQQSRGLMFRSSMKEREGMLFLWDQEIPITMWMKNTWIPLDMFFIDRTGMIIHIAENTTPNSEAIIDSTAPVSGVLELVAGSSKRFGIAVGDRVIHSHFKL